MAEQHRPKDFLEWLNIEKLPNWANAPWLGSLFAASLGLLWLLAFVAAFMIVLPVAIPVFKGDTSGIGGGLSGLGAGALIVALLGAPFLVWRTMIAQRDLNFKKEGHITDRISKAVEQLGAEKKTERIGRPVTVWTGDWEESERSFPSDKAIEAPKRSIELNRDWHETNDMDGTICREWQIKYRVWPSERTVIEWQGEPLKLDPHEHIGEEGEWKVFSNTVPNIEVRIGGILSLERIAQDSTAYDNGRDHVRCMEILCAYIRENAPASSAKNHPDGDWVPLKDDATDKEKAEHRRKREARFSNPPWTEALPQPREDIVQALKVIGRRTLSQRLIEANWPKPGPAKEWVFDQPIPELPDDDPQIDIDFFGTMRIRSEILKASMKRFNGYRPDLRRTNLQKADLFELDFAGVWMDQTRLEAANLIGARLEGVSLCEACLEYATLTLAKLNGAKLHRARLESCTLWLAQLNHADLHLAHFEGASLEASQLNGAALALTQIESADLSGAIGLTQMQIDKAIGNAETKLPRGLARPVHWEWDQQQA